MGRWLAAVLVAFVVTLGAAAGRAEFNPPGLSGDSDGYVNALTAKSPPQPQPAVRDAALAEGRAALAAKDGVKAIAALEKAVTFGAVEPQVWMDLSQAWTLGAKPNRARALQAAYLAYRDSAEEADKAAPLWRLATLFEESFDRPDMALKALRELAGIDEATGKHTVAEAYPTLSDKIEALRQTVGLSVVNATTETNAAAPRFCYRFADPLGSRPGLKLEDFIKIEPPTAFAVDAGNEELCLSGLAYGSAYKVTLRQGLPGANGLVLKKDQTRDVRIGDRTPVVAFRGDGFILPRQSGEGIPLSVVNVNRVALSVYRINDRGLAPIFRAGEFLDPLAKYEGEEVASDRGELVWEGLMEVPDAPLNTEATLAVPFKEVVPNPEPGFYIVIAAPKDIPSRNQPYKRATQWVLVSDIGLTSMEGRDGITVFARSIDTAKPMAGVDVTLVARNNAELARLKTDDQGRVRFPEGLSRGQGGRQPVAVMAYAGADYAVLSLVRAAFDLSDRGVGGRETPGPMDAFVYSDRGVYRQGETVNLSVLLRDDKTEAVGGLPLTVKVLRPSGTVFRSEVLTTSAAGGAVMALPLSKTAPLGGWTVEIYSDPKAKAIGELTFQVDDFVPERLAVELAPSSPWIEAGKPAEVVAKARFLYGPPAAGLGGTAELSLEAGDEPYPEFKGYRFGLIQEKLNTRVEKLEFPKTEADGSAKIAIKLPSQPDTTRPLRATIRVAVSEPGGRPTRKQISLPVRSQAYAIGLHPRFEDRVAEGQDAGFDVVAVSPEGAALAKPNLTWELVEEVQTFRWFLSNGRYAYRVTTRDHSIKTGSVATSAGKPAVVSTGALKWGRYRLEVADKTNGIASSARFSVGWQPAEQAADTPDKLEVTADKESYRAGETAHVRIAPPFAGEVLLTVASDRIYDSRTFSIPASGATVDIPVDAAWGPGAYVTATVYRPPVKGKERQPVRALGLVWLNVDPAARSLKVAVDAPQVVRPRAPLDVVLRLAQEGPAEPAFVTLAAVDEGILQLTDFDSPDPLAYFFGKRKLGIDIRDDYGRLIDPMDGNWGKLRQGGDSSGAGLPVVPFTVVSLFKGPVEVGADGTAKIRLDIPDFNGELRLMAVAYSKTRVGAASQPLTVRDPLVADAVLPRFLAPGDDSRVTVSIHNVEGAAGAFTVELTGTGAISLDGAMQTLSLGANERQTLTFGLKGTSAGIGRVTLAASGPNGANAISHAYDIAVRPAWMPETRYTADKLASGASTTFAAPLLAPFLPGTGNVALTYGSAPPFDVAGILKALDRYPFGCLEQTVSRALPLLSLRYVESVSGIPAKADNGLESRIQQAITSILDRQRFDGSFGLWSASGDSDPWVTAYAMEFLTRARAKGFAVVDAPYEAGLDWLRQHAVDGDSEPADLASRAYALHVLALSGVATPAPARYFADAFLAKLPTPLSKGQVGAALARLGDRSRAQNAFAAAAKNLARDAWEADYGTSLRDVAALALLMSEAGLSGPDLDALISRLPPGEATAARTNTQEQAWLVLAAEALSKGGTPPKLKVGGKAMSGDALVSLSPTAEQLSGSLTVTNAGSAAVWQTVSVSGVAAEPPPAARDSMKIKRNFFTRGGETLNLDAITQNDVFVLVVEGESTAKLYHRAVVTHLLPAGWEIESAHVEGGENTDMPWLTDLSATVNVQGRDDRFTAAVDLSADAPAFKVAVLVRAVTPGFYALPGARVDDMYRPAMFARQPVGRITVLPAK